VAGPFPKVVDGYALPPESPGLGITVDEKAAAEIPFNDKIMQPRLKGFDGSVRDF
jgi:L-alanine-DL-glutamate epimerase-like enolase superfamily enzyme